MNYLGMFHSWDKLDTMGASSRTGVIYIIYKRGDKKTLQTIDPFRLKI